MKEKFKTYISIHLAVILFGFTAILGAVITLPAMILVWWRVMIAGIGLTFFLRDFHFLRTISRLQLLRFIGIGSIISIHWVLFFLSVKLAGASVCLVCMATTCLFVSFIEPILLRKTFRKLDIGIALLIVPGMAMVVQSLQVSRYPGVLAGLSSAFLAAIFSTLNKKYIRNITIWQLSWIEMWSAFLTLSLILIISIPLVGAWEWWPASTDWVYLLILGFVCTTLGHAMSLYALKSISAFALNLVINLEPVYGMVLAALMLGENKTLAPGFYVGATLIILSVFSYPIIQKRLAHAIS